MLMPRAGSSPGSRLSAAVLLGLLPATVVAATVVLAASASPHDERAGVIWCGSIGAAAVTAESVRRKRAVAAVREQSAQREQGLRRRMAAQEAGMLELANVVLPEAVARLQRGEFGEDVMRASPAPDPVVGPEFQEARLEVLRAVLDAVDNEEGMREAAQRAFVNIARRVQAIIHRQAQDLRDMEDRHGNDPAVFDDLLRLDHGNALIGRLADSIAVLGGARPGRQWNAPVPLYSVLRGGISRILDYQRVELHPVSEVAVAGPAVEPLIHALAELLDNATRYSPPQTTVYLTAVEVQTGIAIEIEDGGLSLGEEGRARAERMLKEAQSGLDLNDLGETPRLGLAVVGRLARAYGFQVSLRPSAYGGVRAVLIVPQNLITTAPATSRAHGIGGIASGAPTVPAARTESMARPGETAFRPGQAPAAAHGRPAHGRSADGPSYDGPAYDGGAFHGAAFPGPADDVVPAVVERAANGLPQRRRHAAPPHRGGTSERSRIPEPTREAVQPGLWMAAFHEGVNGHTPSTGTGHTGEESAAKGEQ